jgi:DNA-binding GntR family transcriptional regulator
MSRYQQLADALATEIRVGRIGVGDLLPTEAELTRQFDVSRHTVREALRVLRSQGLITSRQGLGSRVRSASRASPMWRRSRLSTTCSSSPSPRIWSR